MTVVFASKLADGRVYIASDAAVGYADGYRQLMEEGKWWDYDTFFVGESGSDYALSRIRIAFEAANKEPSPETLAECVIAVTKDICSKGDSLGAQLLYADPETLAVVGGDGGVLRRNHDACVGHGAMVLSSYLADRLPPPSKRTARNVSKIVRAGLVHTARMCDSVCDPFFEGLTE